MAACILGVILLPAFIAGCSGPEPPAAFSLHGFEAVVKAGGFEQRITLGAPVETRFPDGHKGLAYPLKISAGKAEIEYRLDSTLHVVRQDYRCGGEDCEHYQQTRWFFGGSLPPLGIGIPLMVKDQHLEVFTGAMFTIPVVRHGNEFQLGPSFAPDLTYVLPAAWRFAENQLVPNGFDQEVLSYSRGPVLANADALVPTALVPGTSTSDLMFPGEEADFLSPGFSTRDYLQAILNDPQHAPLLDGGCFVDFRLTAPQESVALGTQQQASVVVADASQALHRFTVTGTSQLGMKRFQVAEQAASTLRQSCNGLLDPSKPLADVEEFAADWHVAGRKVGYAVSALGGSERPPEMGRFTYSLLYVPDWIDGQAGSTGFASGELYEVAMDAHRGTAHYFNVQQGAFL